VKIKVSAIHYKDPDYSTPLFWANSKKELVKKIKLLDTKEHILEYINLDNGEIFVSAGDDLAIDRTASRLFPGE